MSQVPNVKYFTLAPDWICEVLSPSTEAWDRTEKLTIYGAAGVAWAWLINPILQTLEVLHNRDGEWSLRSSHRAQTSVRAEPFEAIELVLGDLWLPRDPG
jgi:Uma2 family endonuclease